MKACVRSLLCSALFLSLVIPIVSLASPYQLTIGDGEYRLVPASRFQGIQSPVAGQVSLVTFYQGAFYNHVYNFGTWTPGLNISPGQGAIIGVTGGTATFLFQQSSPPTLPLAFSPGFNLVCCQSDTPATYEDIAGRPPAEGVRVYQFNAGTSNNPFNLGPPDYTICTFTNGTWFPTNPVVGITEALFVFEPPHLSNAHITAAGFVFDVAAPVNAAITIQYSDSRTPLSWQVLTNFVAAGTSTRVTDAAGVNLAGQRFYRATMNQ